MEWLIIAIIFLLIGYIFKLILKNLNIKNNNDEININKINNNIYKIKPFMTQYEYSFYLKLKVLETQYKIVPQLNLATVTNKINNNRYRNELFRNIDFAIFNNDYSKLLLLIEINDKTHYYKNRRKRDLKVEDISKQIGVPLMKFYTDKPNEQQYIINRINEAIVNQNLNKKDTNFS